MTQRRSVIGIGAGEYGKTFEEGGPLVWSPFAADTTYFAPSTASFMINYRVSDLDKWPCPPGRPCGRRSAAEYGSVGAFGACGPAI